MSHFLRTIFKGNDGKGRPREATPSSSPIETSPTTYSNQRLHELEALMDRLEARHEAQGSGEEPSRGKPLESMLRRWSSRKNGDEPDGDTMKQLLEALQRIEEDRLADTVTPFDGRASVLTTREPRIPSAAERDSMLGMAMHVCEAAIDALMQKYVQAEAGLGQLRRLSDEAATPILLELLQELEEGPDYLIDVAIIETIIWHAEVIDPGLGAEIRNILHGAQSDRETEPAIFRYTAQSIAAALGTVSDALLDDDSAKESHRAIGLVMNQLRRRVADSELPTTAISLESSLSADALPSERSFDRQPVEQLDSGPCRPEAHGPTATPSATASRLISRASTPLDADFQRLGVNELQQRFGTGTMSPSATPGGSGIASPARPAPSNQSSYQERSSSRAPASSTPQPADTPEPTSPAESEKSIFEYRGNRLTRSALELVLRHEALAMADSSGQYVGEVSWDDVRNAWVPKWAEKMQAGDLADGELPSTNPADFKVKKKDAWGNKIGWWEGQMYYEDEPNFE